MRIKRSLREQVISGLRLAGWTVLGIITCILLVGGAAAAFSVMPNHRVLGGAALTVAASVLVYTVQRWAKLLPGLLLLATFNALVMAKTGTLITNHSVHIPRQVALGSALLLATSCVLSLQFYGRRLGLVDRIALLSYVACTVWGMLSKFLLAPLILGVLILILAWANDRIRRSRITT